MVRCKFLVTKGAEVLSGASSSLWTYIQGQLGVCPYCGSWVVPWGDTRHLPVYNNTVCPLLSHNSLTPKGGFKMLTLKARSIPPTLKEFLNEFSGPCMHSEMEVLLQGQLISVQSEEGNFVTLPTWLRLLYVPTGPNFHDRRSRTFLSCSPQNIQVHQAVMVFTDNSYFRFFLQRWCNKTILCQRLGYTSIR